MVEDYFVFKGLCDLLLYDFAFGVSQIKDMSCACKCAVGEIDNKIAIV